MKSTNLVYIIKPSVFSQRLLPHMRSAHYFYPTIIRTEICVYIGWFDGILNIQCKVNKNFQLCTTIYTQQHILIIMGGAYKQTYFESSREP